MMQNENWVGMMMMNDHVRNDMVRESNHRRLINRCNKKRNSQEKKGFLSVILSVLPAINLSESKVPKQMESR